MEATFQSRLELLERKVQSILEKQWAKERIPLLKTSQLEQAMEYDKYLLAHDITNTKENYVECIRLMKSALSEEQAKTKDILKIINDAYRQQNSEPLDDAYGILIRAVKNIQEKYK